MNPLIPDMEPEIQDIFQLQSQNRWKIAGTDAKQRIQKLKRLQKAILDHVEDIQTAVHSDFGKHADEVSMLEIFPLLQEIRHTVHHLKRWMKPIPVKTPMTLLGSKSRIQLEPKGTVLIISPWNYPFSLAVTPLISAVAAGNCAILKPSEYSPNTSALLKRLLATVFPQDEVFVVEGDHMVAKELQKLPFDHVFFTGSTAVGKDVMKAAAENHTSVTLELGGKSPAVIDRDADLEAAAARITWGKLINAGQTCVAPDYILLPEDKADAFIMLVRKYTEKYYGSIDQIGNNKDFCRIVNQKHFHRLKALYEEALQKGAQTVLGGNFLEEKLFVSPTILLRCPPETKIMQEEIFGPILPVLTYSSLEEALNFINRRDKPLALYIFSRNRRNIDFILRNTTAGGTAVNDVVMHIANPHLPFGGVNHSGAGSYHGYFGFLEFSHRRSVLQQSKLSAAQMLYPPYTEKKNKLLRFMMKFM
jgi:aldehyde dehydrogenase (NAD+)